MTRVTAYITILVKRAELKNGGSRVEVLDGGGLLVVKDADKKGVIIIITYVVKKTI